MSFLACMTSIFHARQFYINSEHIWHILKAKKFNWFFTPFSPFFSTRPTSESYKDLLKVLTEGSMVEYLPLGSQEDPQTIIDKKNSSPEILNHNPSPLCTDFYVNHRKYYREAYQKKLGQFGKAGQLKICGSIKLLFFRTSISCQIEILTRSNISSLLFLRRQFPIKWKAFW